MRMNSLQHLAILAADLPEEDLSDVIELAEKLHQRKCSGCFWSNKAIVDRDVLTDLDLRFCRIEALADELDRLFSEKGERLELGATMMLIDEVQHYRAVLDSLDF